MACVFVGGAGRLRPCRLAALSHYAALSGALLVACVEQDVTFATGVPDPARVPLPIEPAAPAPERVAPPLAAAPPDLPDAGLLPAPPALADPVPDVVPDAGSGEPTLALSCSALPAAPLRYETLSGFGASEDFAFDADGNYVGIDEDENLVRISKSGSKQLWAPATGMTAGMALLPDGSLIVCQVNRGELRRIYPNGASTVVLGGLSYPNGMTIGPDGFVYVAENFAGRVRRVDPETGEFSVVALGLQGPNGVAFGPDPSILYVGSFEGAGVYRVDLAAPGELGSARVFARPASSGLQEPRALCQGLQEGQPCQTSYHQSARCQALANVVDCVALDPCPELQEGQYCDYPFTGECQGGRCVEVPDACKTGQPGDLCHVAGVGDGRCRRYESEDGESTLSCALPDPCDGLQAGDRCQSPYLEGEGECLEVADAFLVCEPRNPCEGQPEGLACLDPYFSLTGTCVEDEGAMYCQLPTGCEGKQAGEVCQDPAYDSAGTCTDQEGTLRCNPPTGCEDKPLGQSCEDPLTGFQGICVVYYGQLQCGSPTGCEGKQADEPCVEPGSRLEGTCRDEAGTLFCMLPTGCEGKQAEAPCEDPFSHVAGKCNDFGGPVLYCDPAGACDGKAAGDGCGDASAGTCVEVGEGALVCEISCAGASNGAACYSAETIGPGLCFDGECVVLMGPGGGIDGLGVDACGNVYATEFTSGIIWRIDPSGQSEQLAQVPSSWIPNVKWGQDQGGFSSTTLYVADRDKGRLFALPIGVPSASALLEKGQ